MDALDLLQGDELALHHLAPGGQSGPFGPHPVQRYMSKSEPGQWS